MLKKRLDNNRSILQKRRLVKSILFLPFLILSLIFITNTIQATDVTKCINITSSGNYSLKNDIFDSAEETCIHIKVNNVIFDCQGYNIDGIKASSSYGLSSGNLDNITVKNCVFTEWEYGIYIYSSINNTLKNNIINNNTYGLFLGYSQYNNITNNTINNNNYGSFFYSSSNNFLTKNNIKENTLADIYLGSVPSNDFCNNKIENNIGSGNNPIKFFNSSVNLQDEVLSELILCNADNSNINNVTIKGSTTLQNNGLFILRTDNSNITQINSSGNYQGISLSDSSYNNLLVNKADNNFDYGIYLDSSSNNTLTDNILNNNSGHGIYLSSSSDNNILNNTAMNNNYGIYLSSSSNKNIITNNTANNNSEGINIETSLNNTIKNNNILHNADYGILIYSGQNNLLIKNTLNYNSKGLFLFYSSNNTFKNNSANYNLFDGFDFSYSTNNILTNNTVNFNDLGIYLFNSSNNKITGNIANNNSDGIYLESSKDNIITKNIIKENENKDITFSEILSDNDCNNIIENNTGSGSKPIKFFNLNVNLQDETLSELILCNADNSNIDNVTIKGSTELQNNGLFILRTDNSNITYVNSSGNYHGIYLSNSTHNNILTSELNNNLYEGVYLKNSLFNLLKKNILKQNGYHGIYLSSSHNNYIQNNTAGGNNNDGIYLTFSSNNTIINNTANNNDNDGVYADSSLNNTIKNNEMLLNQGSGINLKDSLKNTLINNLANDNAIYGIYMESSSNNTFINNTANTNFEGFYLYYSTSNLLTNNTANHNSYSGVSLMSSLKNTLLYNRMNNNSYYGLHFSSSSSNIINNNYIQENGEKDIAFNVPSSDNDCNNIMENNMGSGSKLIKFFNSSVKLQEETLSELILCNADNSNIDNITIKSSATLQNNGVYIYRTDNSNITYINSSGHYQGISLYDSLKNNIKENDVSNNLYYGLRLESSSNNVLIHNRVENNRNGFYLYSSSNNTFINNSANNNVYDGFYLSSFFNSTFTGNSVEDNDAYGIYLLDSEQNRIYNNFFNNTNNFHFSGSSSNIWNTTLHEGIRVHSPGTLIGGNYWATPSNGGYSENCVDNNWDGICDLNYNLTSNNIDYFPLSGDYQNTSLPIRLTKCTNITFSGEYFFENNISNLITNACINIQANNVVLDCHGHIISGNNVPESSGIYLNSSYNDTIKNCIIKRWDYGIYLLNSSNSTIINNTANNNFSIGIKLHSSFGNTIVNNTASYNTLGISLFNSLNNNIINNTINNNSYGIILSSSQNNSIAKNLAKENEYIDILLWLTSSDADCNNIIQNNTGSGNKPIEFYNSSVNLQDKDLSELILCNADNSNINNVTIKGSAELQNNGFFILRSNNSNFSNTNSFGNYVGISLSDDSHGNLLKNNTVVNNLDGFYLDSTFFNTIKENTANNNSYGFYLISSSNNNLSDNTAKNNLDGFYLDSSSANILKKNTANNNTYGIYSTSSLNNTITRNIAKNNSNSGIYLFNSSDTRITNNTIEMNYYGTLLYSSSKNTLINNSMSNNSIGHYMISSKNNTLKSNTVNQNTNYGIYFTNSSDNNIINSTVNGNGLSGISLMSFSNKNSLTNNIFMNNLYGIYSFNSSTNNLTNNVMENNTYGVYLYFSSVNILTNNTARKNDYGIYLYSSLNNTIANSVMSNNSDIGIGLDLSSYNIISNNIADSNNNKGIYLYSSLKNTITNNTIKNNSNGVYLFSSQSNTILNNTIKENSHNDVYIYSNNDCNNIIENNLGSGNKHIKFFNSSVNLQDETLSELILCNADNSNINNVTIEGSSTLQNNGFFVYGTDNSSITDITSSNNNYGFYLFNSSDNTISNSLANHNNYDGIHLDSSSKNTLVNNTLQENGHSDIYLDPNNDCNNIIESNLGSGNNFIKFFNSGVSLQDENLSELILCDADYSNITNVTIEGSSTLQNNGFFVYGTDNSNITNTTSTNNNYGFYLYDCSANLLTRNEVTNNNHGVFMFNSKNNKLYNNVLNNTENFNFSGIDKNLWNTTLTEEQRVYGTGILVGGNYWAKPEGLGYSETCLDINKDGICDQAYSLAINNIDYLPLSNGYVEKDITPPNLSILSPTNKSYTNATILINISSDGDHVWYNWNGTNVTYTTPQYVTFNEGSNTLYAYSNDSSGNLNFTSVSFSVDTTFPSLTFLSPANKTYINATILINISSDGDHVWYNWNGTNVTYTSPQQVTFNEGSNTLYAYSNDSCGNLNFTSVSFSVDTILPTLTIFTPANKSYTNATILINISSDGDHVWYNWNGTNVTYTTPQYVTFNEGSNTLYAYSNDTAGNLNSTFVSFTVDTIFPSLTILSPTNKLYINATILINISSDGDHVWYNWNGTNVTYTSPQQVTFNEGSNTLYAYSNDSCGNLNFTLVSFSVDTSPPEILNVTTSSITTDSAVITWDTLEKSNSSLNYGNTTFLGSFIRDSTYLNKHSSQLTNLKSNTTYYYNINSCDILGNCNISRKYNFSTLHLKVYSVNLTKPNDKIINTITNATYIIKVTNDGNIPDNYTLLINNINNASIAQLNQTAILNLKAGNSVNATLIVGDSHINVYTINITATSNTNTSIHSTISISTQVVSKPVISNTMINPYAVINGSNVRLSIDALNYQTVWAVILKPDLSSDLINLVNNANTTFSDTNLNGKYNVTFYANSSSGDIVNSSDYFEVYPAVLFNGSVISSNQNGLNASLTVYYRNETLLNKEYRNGTFTNNLVSTLLDLKFKTYSNRFQVELRGVNISKDNNKIFGMDRLTIPISGYLVTYGISNNYSFSNATLKIFYDDLSFSKESNLKLYKCDHWDLITQSCSGSWSDITEHVAQNTANDYFAYFTTSFCGFSIKEETKKSSSGGGGASFGTISNFQCMKDSDCKTNQYCSENNCYNYQCSSDDECNSTQYCKEHKCLNYKCSCNLTNGEICSGNKCIKAINLKLVAIPSMINFGQSLNFSYLIKTMSNLSGNANISFWLERGNTTLISNFIITPVNNSGLRNSYLSLPSNLSSGSYDFYLQANFRGHKTQAHKTIEINYKPILKIQLEIPKIITSNHGFNFSSILYFNKDIPKIVQLNSRILEGNKVKWKKEQKLQINRTRIVFENVGRLKSGNYQLELAGSYDGNQTVKLNRTFYVKKGRENLDRNIAIFAVIIDFLFISLFIFWFYIRKPTKQNHFHF